MKNKFKKFISRLYKLHKKYGDDIYTELRECRKYKIIRKDKLK